MDYSSGAGIGEKRSLPRENVEEELRKQLKEEMKRSDDWLKERNQLYEKLDEMSKVGLAYEKEEEDRGQGVIKKKKNLENNYVCRQSKKKKTAYEQLERASQAIVAQGKEEARTIAKEVVVLAAQNSRLEQRLEELQTELEQRTHEIELLSQVNVIQTRQLRHGPMMSDQNVFVTTQKNLFV
ncbi:S-layer-like domain protein [Reticulomyxa filosa]|uniref:S-layer-like domain protein n=1 Tax=Reticulomyxa filosa TaxID=46433 RepID=X6LCN1_RETFI|nr:S-layer-like domain protein [Reticulomyxa filosa]|eukprot:ETN98484.1 S-layer-like domain protein [Reticulomyxa filosa]